MKTVTILGSTGSVGTQTLDVIRKHPDKLRVHALVAEKNIDLLVQQIQEFSPELVGVANQECARALQQRVKIPVLCGNDVAYLVAQEGGYDTVVSATVGLTGIRATLAAIRLRKHVALANKETLVAAGEIVMAEARQNDVTIMPVDSEHSALFQCLNGEDIKTVRTLILTCSGGALRAKTMDELSRVTIEEALGHATWKMGRKITIDSATLMNKGFEVIEAMWLYGVDPSQIKVLIHPESIVHSMVEYSDASVMAQIAPADMRLPIQYALSYPERWEASIARYDFSKTLTFAEPDTERFPCLEFAFEVMEKQGTLGAAMNAANDFMVYKFLAGECAYLDIARVIRRVMDAHTFRLHPTLEEVESAIAESTQYAEREWRDTCR